VGASSRRKGLDAEREVATLFRAFGWEVRGLEGAGDWLCVSRRAAGVSLLHLECKRAERLRIPEWLEQMAGDAPAGSLPVLAFRQNRQPWRVVVDLEQLLELLS